MAVFSSSDGLPKLLEGLSVAVSKKSNEAAKILDVIINKTLETDTDCSEILKHIAQLETLLEWKSVEAVSNTARLVAELSKGDAGRETCSNKRLVELLIRLLKDEKQDIAVVTQACRALGNICYENDSGRRLCLDAGSLVPALKNAERALTLTDTKGEELRHVTAGFLLNLLMGAESAQRDALPLGLVDTLVGFLEADAAKERGQDTATHVLLMFGLLVDAGHSSQLVSERVCKATVNVLATSTSPDLSEMCLEMLHGQAEDEQAKVFLASAGVCELLCRLLEQHKPLVDDDDARNLMKMACDLIVLILTGDTSMNMLYAEGNGAVFKEMVSWLGSDDEDLQITGVLAMGNFARTDKHCIQMVAAGVSKKLLDLVQKNNTSAGDIRLQHALLSALRNLVIPVQNKATVLGNRLVDIVSPMLEIPTFPVVFKLLGTLRMVIDGQEEAARDLGKRSELIGRLVAWCATEDHPGVQGEASRLLAWLIKNSNITSALSMYPCFRDVEVMETMTQGGAVPCLVTMVTAEHAVMQAEALLALCLMAVLRLDQSTDSLLQAKVGESLARLFKEKGATVVKEVVANGAALMEQLIKSVSLKKHLVDSGVSASMSGLLDRADISELHGQIKQLRSTLDAP